jgi:hypothetical protein
MKVPIDNQSIPRFSFATDRPKVKHGIVEHSILSRYANYTHNHYLIFITKSLGCKTCQEIKETSVEILPFFTSTQLLKLVNQA